MDPDEHEAISAIVTDRHYIHIKTWREDGEWWAHVTIDGVLKAHENLGPDLLGQSLTP